MTICRHISDVGTTPDPRSFLKARQSFLLESHAQASFELVPDVLHCSEALGHCVDTKTNWFVGICIVRPTKLQATVMSLLFDLCVRTRGGRRQNVFDELPVLS